MDIRKLSKFAYFDIFKKLKFSFFPLRYKSFFFNKNDRLSKRALQQQLDRSDKLDYPTSQWHSYTNEQVLSYRDRCTLPFNNPSSDHELPSLLTNSANTEYNGLMNRLDIECFGSITASHSDIFDFSSDALIVPIPKCLLPHTGFGLKILEMGGKELVKALVSQTKDLLKITKTEQLNYGDVVITPTYTNKLKSTLIAFVVTPYYWQKSRNEAAQRLRYTFKRCLNHLNSLDISNIVCPHIGESLHGSTIMIQEAFDAIIQVESESPKYSLKSINFVDKDKNTALIMAEALEEVERLRIPSKRTIPAPVYFGRSTARIIEIDQGTAAFLRRESKFSYKKHSGLRKSRRRDWLSNLRPYVWRSARLHEPPPFMVNAETGQPSNYQLEPRTFYYKGVSHSLFPINRAKIKGLRMGITGRWVLARPVNITLDRMSQER